MVFTVCLRISKLYVAHKDELMLSLMSLDILRHRNRWAAWRRPCLRHEDTSKSVLPKNTTGEFIGFSPRYSLVLSIEQGSCEYRFQNLMVGLDKKHKLRSTV